MVWSVTADCFGFQDAEVWCCNLHTFHLCKFGMKKKTANICLGAYLSLAGAVCLLELCYVAVWLAELGGDNKTWLHVLVLPTGGACVKPVQAYMGEGVF